jgi:hypothetical protein
MRHRSFGDFVDKKKRESIRQLKLMKQVLEQNGLKVENFIDSQDSKEPYIFCYSTSKNGSFDGIRIYKIGSELAFRIQKESKTHPYGSAYSLPIESMFSDFLSDDGVNQTKAGKKIIESIGKEIKKFFDRSTDAEQSENEMDLEDMSGGNVLIRTTGTDYSSLVYNKT